MQDMIAMCGPLIALVNKEVQRDMKCYVRTTADLSIENILAQMHLHFRLAVGLLEDDFRWQRRHLLAMHQARGSCRHSRRGRDPSPRTGADCRSARARAGRRSTEDPASRGAHGARRRRAEGKPTCRSPPGFHRACQHRGASERDDTQEKDARKAGVATSHAASNRGLGPGARATCLGWVRNEASTAPDAVGIGSGVGAAVVGSAGAARVACSKHGMGLAQTASRAAATGRPWRLCGSQAGLLFLGRPRSRRTHGLAPVGRSRLRALVGRQRRRGRQLLFPNRPRSS